MTETENKLQLLLRRRRKLRIGMFSALALAVLIAAGLAWRWTREPGSDLAEPLGMEVPSVASAPAPRAGAAVAEPKVAPLSPVPLDSAVQKAGAPPRVDLSDAFVRQAAASLTRNPEVARWLLGDDLLRRFVAAVDNVAEGRSPRSHLGLLRPTGGFQVVGDEFESDPVVLDPRSYRRYDAFASAVDAIEVRDYAALFDILLPSMQQAYAELGYPKRSFEVRLKQAAYELLAAPIVPGEIRLIPQVKRFEYEDLALEDLSDAQKHLLRMGPDNAGRIQRKLREVVSAIDPSWELPQVQVYRSPSDSSAG